MPKQTNLYHSSLTESKVAIILPVYNVDAYLQECLDSIFNQTYSNFTIFAINDGSTDKSGIILEKNKLNDSRLHVITKSNGGISSARNTALNHIEQDSTYKYISFVDSDDIIPQNFLERLVTETGNNNSDVTICGFFKFNNTGKLKQNSITPHKKNIDRDEFVELIFSKKRWDNVCGAGGMVWKNLFRTSTIRGLRFPSNKDIVEDELFCLQVATRAKIISYIPELLYGYRQRENSLIRGNKFDLQLFNGRVLCLEIAKTISEHSAMITISALSDSTINLFKNSPQLPDIDLKPYKPLIIKAASKSFINKKNLKRFIMFCDKKTTSRIYIFTRKILHRLKYRKN